MKLPLLIAAVLLLFRGAEACELCAIYSASSARGESHSGITLNITEQYVSQTTLQLRSEEVENFPPLTDAYLNTSWTHLVPGYNFHPRFGINLSVPIIHRDFRRVEIPSTGGLINESGTESGIGDIALIGRVAAIQKIEMDYSVVFNLMAGVKFPTGDTKWMDREVDQARLDEQLFGPGHEHSSVGGIHQHELTLGSGSYDGIFGTALTARWKRFYLNHQTQYYMRTEARGYEFADMFIMSGGPGAYVYIHDAWTASLQGNVYYETTGSDVLIGQRNSQTGVTAWYAGPQLNFTVGEHVSFNVAADIPLHIVNRGLQSVPDYRIHGGLTLSF